MVLDLSHPEKNSTKFGMVQLDFSRKVDFLISLLALAGLRFSPFDCHVSPVTIDSITLDEWRSWLNQTIAKSDPRWYWRVDDIASSVQMQIDTCRQMIPPEHLENLDWSAIRAMYINRTTWLDEQYRQVAQEYSTPQMDEIEESWMEDTRISQAWEVYLRTNHSNPNIEALLTSIKHPEGGIDSIHTLYFVNYPVFVKCSIGLNTIIGVPKEPGFNIQLVIDKIEGLIK
jgi:hypothetical protein